MILIPVFSAIFLVFIIYLLVANIKVISQSQVGIVMRLGKFHKRAETGINVLVPFLDTLAYRIDLREKVVDFPPQPVITKDNVTIVIQHIFRCRNEIITILLSCN